MLVRLRAKIAGIGPIVWHLTDECLISKATAYGTTQVVLAKLVCGAGLKLKLADEPAQSLAGLHNCLSLKYY